ncbi:MAG: hypothetical protein IKF38_07550 [Clostridia bacterium]|nr:hypothetical protein [Clostridia bacterium]
MRIELENFIIESDNEIKYKNEIIDNLNNNTISILNFFDLKRLSKKKKIIIYNSHEKYKLHMLNYVSEFKDWMIGDTYGENINLLSFDEVKKLDSHKDFTLEKFMKGILHEFVHVCQREYGKNQRDLLWFWEALAVNLSGQTNKSIQLSTCDFTLLKNDFNNVKDNYRYAFELGKFILENYSHTEILEFVKNPDLLREVEYSIFEKALDKQ